MIEEIISILEEHKYLLLGGDVFELCGDEVVLKYDNWYIDEASSIYDSYEKAKSYIIKYEEINNGTYAYSLVFSETGDA